MCFVLNEVFIMLLLIFWTMCLHLLCISLRFFTLMKKFYKSSRFLIFAYLKNNSLKYFLNKSRLMNTMARPIISILRWSFVKRKSPCSATNFLCQKEESMFRNQFPINSYDIQQAGYLLMVIVGIKLWLEPIWHRSTIGLHGHPALSTDVRLEYWAVLTSLCLLDALTIKRVRWFGDIMMKICVLLRSSAEKAGIMSVMSYLLTLGRTGE